jgi:phosphate starvation-inducible protein PhoH
LTVTGKLGICVTTTQGATHLFGLVEAARKARIQIEIFLTGEGVRVTQDPHFSELLTNGRVGVCEVSYIAEGLQDVEIPGLKDKDFVTQARNAEMVEECDRYVVL